MFMTLIVWDIGAQKLKERTKTSNLIVDHFSLTFYQLECCTSMYDFRIRENSQFGVKTIISVSYINLPMYPRVLEPRQVNLSNADAYSEPCQISKKTLMTLRY